MSHPRSIFMVLFILHGLPLGMTWYIKGTWRSWHHSSKFCRFHYANNPGIISWLLWYTIPTNSNLHKSTKQSSITCESYPKYSRTKKYENVIALGSLGSFEMCLMSHDRPEVSIFGQPLILPPSGGALIRRQHYSCYPRLGSTKQDEVLIHFVRVTQVIGNRSTFQFKASRN